jgi:hypothetical protein
MDASKSLLLNLRQASADFDNAVPCPVIHLRVLISNEIKYVESQCTVSSAYLIYDEIFVREVLEQIFGNQTLSDSLTVPWL